MGVLAFDAPSPYGVGSYPQFVTAADLNGDFLLDLAVASYDDGTVSVLLNKGNGILAEAAPYYAGVLPSSVAAADLDGDGQRDLAVANSGTKVTEAKVSVLLNNGDGTFGMPDDLTAGSFPSSVAAADMNGDGKPDLAVANASSGNVSVLLNQGINQGKVIFAPPANYPTGSSPFSVVAAALNGDGSLDLAVANADDNDVTVLFNDGTGTFSAAGTHSVGMGPSSVVAADLDGDMKPDLAVANSQGVSVLINNGDGTFRKAAYYGAGSSSVTAADLNGDKKLDLAFVNNGIGKVSVLLNNGDGSFLAAADSYGAGKLPISVAAADLNNDGRVDLAVVNEGDNTVSVLLNSTCLR